MEYSDPASLALPPLSQDRLLAIIRFQTDIAKTRLDLAEVLQRVPTLAQALTGATGAVVELLEGEEMVYRASSGLASPQLGLRLPVAGSLSGACLKQRRALVCEDSETDPRVDRAACRSVGLRSMAVVPLLHDGSCVGVLKVLEARSNCFEEADLRTLELISEVIGAAMAHAAEYTGKLEEANYLFLKATRDGLTGVGNRELFMDQLQRCLAVARRNPQRLGVALVDMDGLKEINDRLGHQAGDEALRALARRMEESAREADLVARLGGDEFGMLLTVLGESENSATLAGKLARRLHGHFRFHGRDRQLAASVGVATFPEEGSEPEELIARADAQLYQMKHRHKTLRGTHHGLPGPAGSIRPAARHQSGTSGHPPLFDIGWDEIS